MRAFFLVLILVLCTFPRAHAESEAPTETKSEAQRFFQAGVSLQKTEDFEAAIAAYETSLQLFPTKSALFNLANCQRAAHRYADAWHSLHRLRTEFGAELAEPMASTSLEQLEELENLTGLLMVETRPAGAAIRMDDQTVGQTPLSQPLRVAIGQHTIGATAEGRAARSETIHINPRQSLNLSWDLEPEQPRPVVPNVVPAQSPPAALVSTRTANPVDQTRNHPEDSGQLPRLAPTWRTVGWVTVGAGLLSVAAGVRTGALALDVDERLRNQCEAGHCSRALGARIDRLERLSLSSNLFVGVGAVLLATGVTLVFWPSVEEAAAPISVSIGPSSVRLGGAF